MFIYINIYSGGFIYKLKKEYKLREPIVPLIKKMDGQDMGGYIFKKSKMKIHYNRLHLNRSFFFLSRVWIGSHGLYPFLGLQMNLPLYI